MTATDPRDAALTAVLDLHRKAPVYALEAGECEHGDDCDGFEANDGYTYCPEHVSYYTCGECAETLSDYGSDEYPTYPCATVRIITRHLSN